MTMMRVYTFDNAGVAFIPESGWNTPSGPRQGWSDRIPTTGYWKVGDKVIIGKQTIICVSEGIPGEWEFTVENEILGTGAFRIGVSPLKQATGIIVSANKVSLGKARVNFLPNFISELEYVVLVTLIVGAGDGVVSVQKLAGYCVVTTTNLSNAFFDADFDIIICRSAANPINLLPVFPGVP